MPDCTLLSACPFFNDNLRLMPATAGLYKQRYCLSEHTQCARFVVATRAGREHVPEDLFPPNTERATQILASLGRKP